MIHHLDTAQLARTCLDTDVTLHLLIKVFPSSQRILGVNRKLDRPLQSTPGSQSTVASIFYITLYWFDR